MYDVEFTVMYRNEHRYVSPGSSVGRASDLQCKQGVMGLIPALA